jgi:hypothetical protein
MVRAVNATKGLTGKPGDCEADQEMGRTAEKWAEETAA